MFKLEMDTNNAAFQSDREGGPEGNSEIARLLCAVAADVNFGSDFDKHGIVDFNGNVVGHYQLTQD